MSFISYKHVQSPHKDDVSQKQEPCTSKALPNTYCHTLSGQKNNTTLVASWRCIYPTLSSRKIVVAIGFPEPNTTIASVKRVGLRCSSVLPNVTSIIQNVVSSCCYWRPMSWLLRCGWIHDASYANFVWTLFCMYWYFVGMINIFLPCGYL
jgi:hypothetical protein